jgi:hypothetical protein
MTWLEIYAFFGAPLVAVAVGYGLYRWGTRPSGRP